MSICVAVWVAVTAAEPQDARLRHVATARQAGPIAYLDPVGAISPDGKWIAYVERSADVYVRAVDGGPASVVPPLYGRVRALTWLSNSRALMIEVVRARINATAFLYDLDKRLVEPLWHSAVVRAGDMSIDPNTLRDVAFSPDGKQVAGVVRSSRGSQLWIVDDARGAGGTAHVIGSESALSSPAWMADGRLACVVEIPGSGPKPSIPCGAAPASAWKQNTYGGIALAPDGRTIYYAAPNARGTLDLWSRSLVEGRPTGTPARLTQFSRDTYAPSVARDGRVLVRTQIFDTHIAAVPATGGASRPLTTFDALLPAWHPTGKRMGVTFGPWRTMLESRKYPDIAQDLGEITVTLQPASAPSAIIHASPSEEQGLSWSPNGRWIAFHSHREQSDGIWIIKDRSTDPPRRVKGIGFEAGAPSWSPDGQWIAYTAYTRDANSQLRRLLLVSKANQDTGEIADAVEVPFDAAIGHPIAVGWMPGAAELVIETMMPDTDVRGLWILPRDGGRARPLVAFKRKQFPAGISVSPDGSAVAYIAPAADGFDQVWTIAPRNMAEQKQITTDPSDKGQPAWSPDGSAIAMTVWRYESQFWIVR